MARIRTYDLDDNITANDYLLGNDGDNGSVITKRFSIEDLQDYFGADVSFITGNAGESGNLGKVPKGYTVVVNQSGNGVERSTLNITHTPTLDPIVLASSTETLAVIEYSYGSNGRPTIQIENFSLPYHLPSFEGKSVSFTTDTPVDDGMGGLTNPTFTATIDSYDGFEQVGENIIDTFTLSAGPQQGDNNVTSLTVTNGGTSLTTTLSALTVGGDLDVGGELDVAGDVALATDDGRVDIGESTTHQSEVHVHGTLHFDEPQDGIVFGPPVGTSDMTTTTFTLDSSGDMIVQGSPSDDEPNWNFRDTVNVNFDAPIDTTGVRNTGSITSTGDLVIGDATNGVTIGSDGSITTTVAGAVGPELIQITANNSTDFTTTRTEELASVQIGAGNFTLPEFSAGVAEALPGFNETLGANPVEFASGRFFVGREQSAGAIFVTVLTPASGRTLSFTVPSNATSVDLGDDGDNDVTDFENLRSQLAARGNDQERLFFVESTYTDAFPAVDEVLSDSDTNIYEVISYNDVGNIVTFGLLGEGTINIATSTLNISSEDVIFSGIPTEAYDGDVHDFVTVHKVVHGEHPIDTLSRSSLNIAATANGARITEEDGQALGASIGVTSLEFTGNHNVSRSTGDVTLDLSGRYNVRGEITQSSDLTSIDAFDVIVLRPTDSGSDQTLTLPIGGTGDSIKIINTSTINADGTVGATTGQWNIAPDATQTIMGIASSDPLDLDDPTASFELIYTGGDMGWIINGIN